MKRIFTGNDNRIKRRISAVMAGVIVLTTVGSVTYLKQHKVEAKETLYSIEKVISDLNTKKGTYRILEIVPVTVSANVSVNYVSGNETGIAQVSIIQKPGYMGYYVGGSEPVRDDVNDIVNAEHTISYNSVESVVTTLDSSSLRYSVVDAVYDTIRRSDVYDEERGPFSLEDGYREIRQGEYISDRLRPGVVTNLELEEGLSDKSLGRIIRDTGYIDEARGIMTAVTAGSDEAHYVLRYVNSMSENGIDENDPAYRLLKGYSAYCEGVSGNNIRYEDNADFLISNGENEDRTGQFDPYLEPDSSDEVGVYAVFEEVFQGDTPQYEISNGYRITSATPVDKSAFPVDGTPIYEYNAETGRYTYFMDCNEEFRNMIVSLNSANDANGTSVTSTEVENIEAFSDNKRSLKVDVLNEDDIESNVSSKDDLDGESLIDDANEGITEDIESAPDDETLVEDSEIIDGEIIDSNGEINISVSAENAPNEVSARYFTLKFEYFADFQSSSASGSDPGFYCVKSFRYSDKAHGAEYSIFDDKGLLVPNMAMRGVISVKDACPDDNLLYEYNRKSSLCNLRWEGDESSDRLYRITGAEIYYSYGIENKEWFKRYVFDRDCYPYDIANKDADTASKLKVIVDRKTAAEVEASDIIGKSSSGDYTYRMMVLMAGYDTYCVGSGKELIQYAAKVRDITSDVYVQTLYRVADIKAEMPIIVDHNIIAYEGKLEKGFRDSLMYNLAYALTFDDVTGYSGVVYSQTNNIRSGELAGSDLSPAVYVSNNSCRIIDYNDYDYVNSNIYMYNRKTDGLLDRGLFINPLNVTFNDEFKRSVIDKGFIEVEQDIENEKMYRSADYSLKDKPLTNTKVTEATVIRYIIGHDSARVTEGKGEVTVLELEPTRCFDLSFENKDITNDYTSGSDEFNKLAIEEKDPNDENKTIKKIYEGELFYKNKSQDDATRTIIKQKGLKINLKQMTTSEFVGHVEDLNATYDLIYIGMNTGEYKDGGNGKYVYYNSPYEWRKVGEDVVLHGDWRDHEFFDWSTEWAPFDSEQGKNANYVTPKKPNVNVPQQYNYFESEYGNYYYLGLQPWDHTRNDYIVRKYEKGYYETQPGISETYGGFHHRLSTQEDVDKGRATAKDQIITDFNDDNMDGLVYCNVGDMTYITETVGGSLKVWNGETDVSGNKVYTWPEYTGGERYLNKDDEKNHIETDQTHIKGYGYITQQGGFKNDATKGYSIDENGNRKNDNYSLYRTRYSGNDITKDNMNALIDYSRAGYPIILADGFYKEYNNETRKGKINDCTVDNASYMYAAIKTINEESSDKNIFIQSYIPANLFNWYVLNLGKPTIKMTEDICKKAQTSTVYLGEESKTGDGHYNAYYRFKIDSMGTAAAGTKYTIGLFIDINADGKYSEKSEGIAFSSLKNYKDSTTVSPVGTDPKTNMPIYELEPGNEYEAKCRLSGSFIGCLPWRLRVSQIGNPYRRSNADGYYAVRNNEKSINILQIRPNNDDNGNDPSSWNMETDYNRHQTFYNLIENTAYMPFKVNIKSVTVNQFQNITADRTANGYYEYLRDHYDMVIMGFIDIYRGPNIEATKGIKKYIENGYSVLFTHDCTSFVNSYDRTAKNPNGDNVGLLGDNWGYEFNSVIRNLVGMDRYDVLAESKHENEKPYKPRSGGDSKSKVVLDYEAHGFTYLILNHWGYQRSSNVLADVKSPGWTGHQNDGHNNDEYPEYLSLQLWNGGVNWDNHGFKDEDMLPYANYVGASLGSGQYGDDRGGANWVSQINKGQITQYPYVLKENFTVAKTHAQYYQLDFTADDDNDGESDIVVWYCISTVDDESADWSRPQAGIKTSEKNMYNVSPNDVRNNYYIYNKGNVTYSGVGHSTPTGEDEFKLFINTMIAAYRTGLHEPDLAIVDSYKENPDKIRQLYVSYDDEIRKAVVASSVSEVDDDTVNVGTATDVTNVNKNSDIDNILMLNR